MSIYETNLDQNLANYTVLSPLSFLERSRKTFPDQIAIEYEDYKLTYKQAAKRCNALSELLKSYNAVSYTHLRAHETAQYLVCRISVSYTHLTLPTSPHV